jgi:hypothetical protein
MDEVTAEAMADQALAAVTDKALPADKDGITVSKMAAMLRALEKLASALPDEIQNSFTESNVKQKLESVINELESGEING